MPTLDLNLPTATELFGIISWRALSLALPASWMASGAAGSVTALYFNRNSDLQVDLTGDFKAAVEADVALTFTFRGRSYTTGLRGDTADPYRIVPADMAAFNTWYDAIYDPSTYATGPGTLRLVTAASLKPPVAPALTLAAGNKAWTATWPAIDTGGSALTALVLQHRVTGTQAWTDIPLATGARAHTLGNRVNGASYDAHLKVTNANGTVYSDVATVTPNNNFPAIAPSPQSLPGTRLTPLVKQLGDGYPQAGTTMPDATDRTYNLVFNNISDADAKTITDFLLGSSKTADPFAFAGRDGVERSWLCKDWQERVNHAGIKSLRCRLVEAG